MSTLERLGDLNQGYVRAAQNADVEWYREHLADDFLISTADGALSDKDGFLRRLGRGAPGSGRYTDIWALRQGRWLCISAHFNRF
jgi:hypothetical protein